MVIVNYPTIKYAGIGNNTGLDDMSNNIAGVNTPKTNPAGIQGWEKIVGDINGAYSQISVNTDNINLKVSKNDVINQINISTEGILIQGKAIEIDGDTTVNGTFSVTSIGDAGDLATKDRNDLQYEDGADVTGNHTANDTNNVNGLSASVVHGWAYTNNTTYIDGGKLYTGTVNADYVKANVSISSPTITGGTIQTSTSGQRVIIDGANNHIQFYNSNGDDAGYIYGHTYTDINGNTNSAINVSGAFAATGQIACYGGFITNGNSWFENNDNNNPTLKIKNDGSGASIEAYGDNDSSVIYASNNNSNGYSIYGAGYVGGDNLFFANYLVTSYGYLYSSSDGHLHWHNNVDGSTTQIV